jgi:hypothetical protein
MRFSKSVLQILDNAIGQQLDTVDLTKQAKLAVELLQARRDVRAALNSKVSPELQQHINNATREVTEAIG